MQEAEWVLGSFIECFVIGERLDKFSIKKFVNFRNIKDSHWSLVQEFFHQRKTGLLARFNPNITTCCIEDR